MSRYIQKIKEDQKNYALHNQAVLPVSAEYLRLKELYKIKSFFQLPEAWQEEVKRFIHGERISQIFLVGSLASGSGIIPNVTPDSFVELRKKYSFKEWKKQSDIDLYCIQGAGQVLLKKQESDIVNIEALPHKFTPAAMIYANGKFI